MRTAVQANFQYRADTLLYMVGTIVEPVVYLVVWSTVARAQGDVAGITAGGFAAYYIVWTLVRQFNLAFTPYGWEWRIREGRVSRTCCGRSTRSTTTSRRSPAGSS